MTTDLQSILNFVQFTQRFKEVEREIVFKHPNGDVRENDAEHSFQLALVAWYIISAKKLPLDINRVLEYALVHDLVETYAGDTRLSETNQAYIESKAAREAEALKQIVATFPEFIELPDIITRYEHRSDEESKFVYALDKMIPVLNIYIDGGYSWKKNTLTLEKIVTSKKDKIALSPVLEKIWLDMVEILRANESTLFGTQK